MKKIIYILVTFSLFVTFTGCSDDDYSSKYLDPSKVTSVSIPNLMNGTFMRMRDYSTYGYYRFFAFDPIFVGKFAQSFGHGVGADMYESGYSGYTEGQFGSVYTTMMDYKMLVSLYEEASDEDKKNFESFKLATEVHYFDFLLAAVDLYGDMPYSEACRLPLEKDLAVAQPVYDKAEDIYSDVLDKLKVCAERFNSSDLVQYGNFSTQDFICMGDFNKWARYANSVRLRAALRISEYGSLAEKGKSIIAEIVGNPGQYPLIETNDKNVFLRNDHTGELNLRPGGFDWVSCRRASGAIVDRMLSKGNYRAVDSKYVEGTGTYVEGVDDPRILLLYSMRGIAEAKDGKVTTYRGAQDFCYPDVQKGVTTESSINPIFDDGKPVTLFFSGVDVGATVDDVSYYDDGGISEVVQDGFFWNNGNFEHVQMTASEVLFAKAEAYHKGLGVAKDEEKAEQYFKDAVVQSIKLYYHWNEDSEKKDKTGAVSTPSDDAIAAYAAARWTSSVNPAVPYSAADPKLDAILTQKWLHWGIFFSRQSWSQIRRTGLPKLIYPNSGGIIEWAPDRWRYPLTELNYNKNYPGVDKDLYYGQLLFWANPKGMRHSVQSGGVWSDQYGD